MTWYIPIYPFDPAQHRSRGMYTLKVDSFKIKNWCKDSLDRDEVSQENLCNAVIGIYEGLKLIMGPVGWRVVEHDEGGVCLYRTVICMTDCAY